MDQYLVATDLRIPFGGMKIQVLEEKSFKSLQFFKEECLLETLITLQLIHLKPSSPSSAYAIRQVP